ncbi:MAG TPA: peptidoglycan DD-metalloendopeptidase family protein [Pseudonocardia sp.]|nr:peptidoglycan DD-metalloendopeptidase family protein [Pseudonocardia sp.]
MGTAHGHRGTAHRARVVAVAVAFVVLAAASSGAGLAAVPLAGVTGTGPAHPVAGPGRSGAGPAGPVVDQARSTPDGGKPGRDATHDPAPPGAGEQVPTRTRERGSSDVGVPRPGTTPGTSGPATGPTREPGAGEPVPGAAYAWPLHPAPAVLTPFRAPAHPYGPGHRGADLAGRAGQEVLASRAGAVVFAGPVGGRGVVSVEHDGGLRTTYEPVEPLVGAGAVVARGEVIGLLAVGHAGCAAVCLHWGARRDRLDYVDPLMLLRPARVRLLPVPEPWPG